MVYKILILGIVLSFIGLSALKADIKPEYKNKKNETLQRAPTGLFDNQKNTVSNLEFFSSNYGIFGYDVANRVGGGYWPRNSKNQYIFAGGAWFAAMKPRPGAGNDENNQPIMKQYVVVTYDPSNGQSWFVPGRIRDKDDKPTYEADFNDTYKYKTYFSTDFNRTTGEPIESSDRYNWPIWDIVEKDTLKNSRYFGLYVEDDTKRNLEKYPKGPAFISGEDIFSTFKDTDLNYYTKGYGRAKEEGYPLYIQIEHMIYSWGFGQYKDFVFLKYDFINMSPDILVNCWHAPIMDVDIARSPFTAFGARNDRVSFYDCDTSLNLNMAVQWSGSDNGEQGFGFGYLGFDYLESPSVNYFYTIDPQTNQKLIVRPSPEMDAEYYFNRDGDTLYRNKDTKDMTNFLRKTKRVYPVSEQLGLVTFQNWSAEDDKSQDEDRYNYMAEGIRSGNTGPGDKRYLMATGPYNMLPRDTARVVVGVILARTDKGGEALGTDNCDDMKQLEILDIFAQDVYDNNFKSPLPPERPVITEWTPLNNGIMIKWDNTSEYSFDENADGLDFLGYKIYRSRRPELDTFNTKQTLPAGNYQTGTGPLGWKQVAEYRMPFPFRKSNTVSGTKDSKIYPIVDSLRIAGPVVNNGQAIPLDETFGLYALNVMRVPSGGLLYDTTTVNTLTNSNIITESKLRGKKLPILAAIDTSGVSIVTNSIGETVVYPTKPWAKYMLNYAGGNEGFNSSNTPNPYMYFNYFDEANNNKLLKDIVIGKVFLNRSLVAVNPLHYKRRNIKITKADADYIKYLKDTPGATQVIGNQVVVREKELTDSVVYNTRDSTYMIDTTTYKVSVKDTVWKEEPAGSGVFVPTRKSFFVDLPKVDSVYYYNTLSQPFGTNEFSIDISIQRADNEIMADHNSVKETLDSVHVWLINGTARVEWPEVEEEILDNENNIIKVKRKFEETLNVRSNVISPFMALISNNRTLIDVGDDDKDGIIKSSDDPTLTEKLINNVNYFYKIIPFDEGDYTKNFPQQPNTTPFSANLDIITNIVKVFPEATSVGPKTTLEIIDKTEELLGGISNINFFSVNNDRVKQLFSGDTLELSWTPVWFDGQWVPIGSKNDDRFVNYSLLARRITLVNISDNNKLLYQATTQFEPIACTGGLVSQLTENAGSYVLAISDSVLVDSASRKFVNGEAVYDTITLNQINSLDYVQRRGKFTTGRFDLKGWCYQTGFTQEAYGTIGFEYDFTVRQYGGIFRSALVEKLGDAANRSTIIKPIEQNKQFDPDRVHITQTVNYQQFGIRLGSDANGLQSIAPNYSPVNSSFNNGPGEYVLEFLPGGTETKTFKYGGLPGQAQKEITFELTYLNVKVTNQTVAKRFDKNIGDSVLFPIKPELNNVLLPVSGPRFQIRNTGDLRMDYLMYPAYYPHPKNLTVEGRDPLEFLGNFNIYNVGWIGLRERANGMPSLVNLINRLYAFPTTFQFDENIVENAYPYSGLQGKYYLSASTQVNGSPVSIDFTHVVNISGAQYVFDFANAGRITPNPSIDQRHFDVNNKPEPGYDLKTAVDFRPGDQVKLTNWGSALGLPAPGAKVRVAVKSDDSNYKYTEDDLKGIEVVPNPYYITHQSQRSVYDAQIFFTRLPKSCNIKIYTMAGDMVKEINHESSIDNERRAVEVWDIISKNGFRVQSQVLVAVITTPDGETVTKTFSVVVGSFRILD